MEKKMTAGKSRLELLQDVLACKTEQVKLAEEYNKLQLQYNDLLSKTNSLLIDQYNVTKDLNFAIGALKYIAENAEYGLHDENTEAAKSALIRLRTPSTDDPLLNDLEPALETSDSEQCDLEESDHPLADRNPNGDNQENS